MTWPSFARAANDPELVYKTLESPHFRITYYSGEEELAEHVADLAEDINARLVPVLGWQPKEKVEISLNDQTDSANGFTSAAPYNAIRLLVTAPDDLSPLGDVDDWYQELVTHEYTHTLHLDHITGIPALWNQIVGRVWVPNQVQPRWILEGLAVYDESEHTSGGRLRSSTWNMFMRADVLENNVAPLDQFSNTPRRWPQGNIWYLYGSFFMNWISETYGEQAIRAMIRDYGWQPVPYGVNRSIRRATGRTWDELYPAWIASLKRQFGDQAAEIRKKGLREGVQLTHLGGTAQHPRFIPQNAWSDHAGDLLYFRDDQHTTGGLYAVPIRRDASGAITKVDEKNAELVVRTNVSAAASFEPNGNVVFDTVDYTANLFGFDELFEMKAGEKNPSGLEWNRKRLTYGFRANDPSVSPDGKRIVFETNHRGTRYLQIADFTPDGIKNVRALVKSNPFEQVFGPTWSPDNRHVAYSVWTEGGYRDIRYVDTFDGSYIEVTHDRAVDSGPAFSPDGIWLFFHSDRTRVSNIFAWQVGTSTLMQVTNVINGAFQPAISPDGKTLAYIGYTHMGYDLFAMKLDPSQWTPADPYVDDRPAAPPPPIHHEYVKKPYNALETLRPHSYGVQVAPSSFGYHVSATTSGTDIAELHSFGLSLGTDTENPELSFDAQYAYGGFPVDLSFELSRSITPVAGPFVLNPGYVPLYTQENTGFGTSATYAMPGSFDGQSVSVGYSITRFASDLPEPANQFNPYDTPQIPQGGLVSDFHLGWGYSNAQSFLWSVAGEKGFSVSANLDATHPELGSQYAGFAANMDFTQYYTMPWLRHHSLALHAGAGTSAGSFPGRGPYYVGGFVDLPVYDTVRNVLIQGGVTLRGYPPVIEAGSNFVQLNAEYHFPIVNVDRGISTLPIFLERINGAVFCDYGSAFNDAASAEFKTGVGGELWFDTTLSYVVGFTFRLGYAKGLASGGLDKVYFVAAVPF